MTLRRISSMGAGILPRHVADQGQMNWPKCAICMRAVDSYGIEEETAQYVQVWAQCDGIRRDPQSGNAVHGAPKMHEMKKGSVHISKLEAVTFNQFSDIVRRLAFFKPTGDGERNYVQQYGNPDTIRVG
jgi:hypothetical protein